MENEQIVVAETEVTAEAETTEVTTDSKVKLTDEEKLARLEGGAARLRKKLGLEKPAPKEESKKVENKKSDELLLEKLERLSLRSAGLTHHDDIELAKNTAKKWGVDVDEVLVDEDFKVKLERQQTNRANVEATSGVKGGGGGGSDAKNTPEYWIAKGVPPTREQVPDRKTRANIVRAMMAGAKTSGKKFYND